MKRSRRSGAATRAGGRRAIAVAAGLAAVTLSACGSSAGTSSASSPSSTAGSASTGAPNAGKALRIAYLPFAVANSYEAPMLAAAQAAASAGNATLTVLAANNSPQTQYAQLQNALDSGQYQGIIAQPILSTGLIPLVAEAQSKGVKVVTMDQILGPILTTATPQVPGVAASVVFVPTTIGTKLGQLVVQACASKKLDPCNVGYLYDLKASSLDVALHDAFVAAIASTPVHVVGEGEDYYTPTKGLSATQNLLQANPSINVIVGSDQGIEGAVQAVDSAGTTGKVLLVGYGGSVAGVAGVASGAWFGDIGQVPATEGRLAVAALLAAVRTNATGTGTDATTSLPDGGVITQANAAKFHGEWPG